MYAFAAGAFIAILFTSQTLNIMTGTLLYEIISLSMTEPKDLPVSFIINAAQPTYNLESVPDILFSSWGRVRPYHPWCPHTLTVSQNSSRSYSRHYLSRNAEHPLLGCDSPC